MNKPYIVPVNDGLLDIAQKRLDSLTKPQGSLGRLEEFARKLVLLTGQAMPRPLTKKAIFTFAGISRRKIPSYTRNMA